MYVRIGVRGSNRGIVIGTIMTRFQDRDKANVCTFASELINSQPLSALVCLHLKIANQELGSLAVCTYSLVSKERHARKESNDSTLGLCIVPKESHGCTVYRSKQ